MVYTNFSGLPDCADSHTLKEACTHTATPFHQAMNLGLL